MVRVQKAPINGHSEIGASVCERLWHCPASRRLAAAASPPEPTEAAAKGTVLHAIAERILKNKLGLERYALNCFEGCLWQQDGFEFRVDAEMLSQANVYVDFYMSLVKKHKINNKKNMLIEARGTIPNKYGLDLRGTIDSGLVVPFKKVYINDFKSGWEIVPVVGNKQLSYYGATCLTSIPAEILDDIETFEYNIIQPSNVSEPISTWKQSKKEVMAFVPELIDHMRETYKPDAAMEAGSWCKYCPAQIGCPAYEQKLQDEAEIVFSDDVMELQQPGTLPPDKVLKILEVEEMALKYFANVRSYALGLAKLGKLPGYKVETGLGNRKWKDAVLAAEEIKKHPIEDPFTKPELKSPTQIMKSIEDTIKTQLKSGLMTDKQMRRFDKMKTSIEEHIIREATAEKLVRGVVVEESESVFDVDVIPLPLKRKRKKKHGKRRSN